MKPTLLLALLFAPLALLHAAEPVVIDLKQRTWQGIPGLERTAKGRVYVSWFTGGPKEPSPDNTVVLSYSDDAGKTFTPPEAMGLPTNDGTRCFDPTLWIDPKGRLWYIFNRGNKDLPNHDVWARICEAPDAPKPSFGPEFRVGYEGPYAFRMNKPTVLSTDRWPVFVLDLKTVSVPDGGLAGSPLSAVAGLAGGLMGGIPGSFTGAAIGQMADQLLAATSATATYAASVSRLQIALRGVSDGLKGYGENLRAVNDISNDFAMSVDKVIVPYTKLQASIRAAGYSANTTKQVFEAVAAASIATGGSAEDLEGSMRAVTQIFAKGTVQSEELVGQLAERIPGAFSLFAEANNMTTASLKKALEQGQVGLNEFLTFTKRLQAEYEESAKVIVQSQEYAGQRLEKATKDLQLTVGTALAPIGAAYQDMATNAIVALDGLIKKTQELGILGTTIGSNQISLKIANGELTIDQVKRIVVSLKEMLRVNEELRNRQLNANPISRFIAERSAQLGTDPLALDIEKAKNEIKAYNSVITREEARTHARRNIVTRALGIEPSVAVDTWTLPLLNGDRYILCSDGLVDEVTDEAIEKCVRQKLEPQKIADQLVSIANANGGRDNITVIVVDVIAESNTATLNSSPKQTTVKKSMVKKLVASTAVAAVAVVAIVLVSSYLRSGYFVAYENAKPDARVLVYRGKNFLWVSPTVEADSTLNRRDLSVALAKEILAQPSFSSSADAQDYVNQIRNVVEQVKP
ncbi:MAG: hypothetical protein EBV51_01515 [Acidimicrobiia bacterium]|nr:hypothetical protein [Acidimicrobiia bacterium]